MLGENVDKCSACRYVFACDEQVLPQMFGASPSGKASAFGADIRWFESSRPSHIV